VEFTVLGPVRVTHSGHDLGVRTGLEISVLTVLLLDHGRVVPLDRMVDLVWGPRPPVTVRALVHNMVSRLRRRFAAAGTDAAILTHPTGYELRPGPHELDLARFRELAAEARRAYHGGDPGSAADRYDEALSLWRGPALVDVVEPLATALRPALREEWFAAVEERLDAELAVGRYDKVLAEVAGLLRENPLREELYRRKMLALRGCGRRADALVTFQEAYRRMVDELGVEPSAALRELQHQILRGEEAEPVDGTTGAGQPSSVPRELPTATEKLLGREELIAQVGDLLGDEEPAVPPVAVLTGQAGVGKTTVAVHVGHRLAARFPDGQLYADLRGVRGAVEPYQVLGRLLRALGLAGHQVPDDLDERITIYRSRLAGRRVLVVLDDAYDEHQVRPLLPGEPGCAAIVTSRRRLDGLEAGCWTVPVLDEADAEALFERVVGAERTAAEPVASRAVASACGGLPLAVRIAAARVAAREDWTIEDFAERLTAERGRLDELVAGDLDVRASIGLSFGMLDPDLCELLRGLGEIRSVTWPAWVAGALADGPVAMGQRRLDRLVEVHLVEPVGRDLAGQPRFRLHDLVREFVREQQSEGQVDTGPAVDRMLEAFSALAAQADTALQHGLAQTRDMPLPVPAAGLPVDLADSRPRLWFEAEWESLVAGVGQAVACGRADLAYELALFTHGFLMLRRYDEREATLLHALDCAERAGHEEWVLRLLGPLVSVYMSQQRYDEVPAIAMRSVEASRRLGDEVGEILGRLQLASAELRRGYLKESERHWRDSLARGEAGGVSPYLTEWARGGLAHCVNDLGRPGEALPLYEQVMEYEQRHGVTRRTAIILRRYARAQLATGNPDRAGELLREALAITEELGDDVGTAHLRLSLGDVDLARGRWQEAEQRFVWAYVRLDELGDGGSAEALRELGRLELIRGRHDVARRHLILALQRFRGHGARLEVARILSLLAAIHRELDDAAAARRCSAECDELLAELELDGTCLLPAQPPASPGAAGVP